MERSGYRRRAENALAAHSRHQAETELARVDADRFAAAITEFVKWRAFAYWVRLIAEKRGTFPVQAILQVRCPGFLESLTEQRQSHPEEPEFLWLHLIDWIDVHCFQDAQAEGWQHALGYCAARGERLDRVRAYWARCDEEWDQHLPTQIPEFEEWRRAALGLRGG
jgi:hypothetical protein